MTAADTPNSDKAGERVERVFPCVYPSNQYPYCGKNRKHLEACPAYHRDAVTELLDEAAASTRTELSALKARVEAAEGLLREVSEFIDTESRVVKAMAERAQQITGSIDAALTKDTP